MSTNSVDNANANANDNANDNACGRGIVINNTIFALVGSTVGALLFWTFGKKKM